ncbi:hypothetical protein KEM52_000121, partial [Ascosphaera acerosa]
MASTHCISCSAVLQHIEYQSRAADEAHRQILVCPHCPLDASKVSLELELRTADISTGLIENAKNRIETATWRKKTTLHRYVFSATLAHPHRQGDVKDLLGKRVYIDDCDLGGRVAASVLNVQGLNDKAIVVKNRDDSNVLFAVKSLSVYDLDDDYPAGVSRRSDRVWFTNYTHAVDAYITQDNVVLREGETLSVYVVPSSFSQGEVMRDVFTAASDLGYLAEALPFNMLKGLMNLSSHAWDVKAHTMIKYLQTHKVDGERMFIFVMYPMVFWTRQDPWLSVLSMSIIEGLEQEHAGYALLDVPMTTGGKFAPAQRSLEWVAKEATKFVDMLRHLDVRVREYWVNTPTTTPPSTEFLCDCLVAIDPLSIAAMKLKDVYSMELMVRNGRCLTLNNDAVFDVVPLGRSFQDGDVVEVEFTRGVGVGVLNIDDVFKRVDKTAPNSTNAVTNILMSVCRYINDLVEDMDSPRPLIIDVGSGDGQSLDSMNVRDGHFLGLFVEPDRATFESLCACLGVKAPPPGTMHVRSMLKALVTRRRRVGVCNSTLRELLENTVMIKELMEIIRAIVGTFSLHFVILDLYRIVTQYGTPVYGCVYVYDGIESDGVLIDTCGVRMAKLENGRATASDSVEP